MEVVDAISDECMEEEEEEVDTNGNDPATREEGAGCVELLAT